MRVFAPLSGLLVIAIGITSACSGGGTEPTPPAPPTPGIHFVAGTGSADTIGAILPQALVVEVRDQDGLTVSGVLVRFESVVSTPPGRGAEYETLLSRLDQSFRSAFVSDMTDSKGRASALVQLGTFAGAARVVVSAPIYGFVDTASFTARPGNPARITLKVRDTVAVVGSTYPLEAAASDRAGNAVTSAVLSFVPSSNVVSVDGAGAVKALAVGRGVIDIRAGTFRDSASISVVPDLTLAVVSTRDVHAIATIKLDGTQLKTLTTVSNTVMLPRWNLAGTQITFYEGDPNSNAQVYLVDLQGNRSTLLNPVPADPRAEFFPRYSPDGQWVYFTGQAASSWPWALWRAHADGSALEQLASAPDASYYQASPSPDGTRLAFNAGGTISTIDLATRTITSLNVQGNFPEYSPDGTKLLFIVGLGSSGQLGVMNADGSNVRVLADHSYDVYSSPSWSHDGKWIVLGGPGGYYSANLNLINTATFEVIPLTTLRGVDQAAIKP